MNRGFALYYCFDALLIGKPVLIPDQVRDMLFRKRSSEENQSVRKLLVLFPISLFLALAACGEDEIAGGEAQDSAASTADNSATAQKPSSGPAVRTDGTIEAVLDGEQRTWYITSGEHEGQQKSQSGWESQGSTGAMVTLLGHTSAQSTFGTKQAIIVGFTLYGIGGNVSVESPEVTYLKGGFSDSYATNMQGDASVTVTSAEIDGDILKVSGSFRGSMSPQAGGKTMQEGGKTIVSATNGTFEAQVIARPTP